MPRGYPRAQRATARVRFHPKRRGEIIVPGVLVLVRNRMSRWQMPEVCRWERCRCRQMICGSWVV